MVLLLIIGFFHLLGGTLYVDGVVLYKMILFGIPFDKLIHFFGSFFIGLIIFDLVFPIVTKKSRDFVFIFVFFIALGITSFVEILEYLAYLLFEVTIIGDYKNNVGDLFINGLGVFFSLLFIRFFSNPLKK